MSLDQHALQGWLVAGLPVQQLPVLSTPPVFEFLRVHASDLIKIRLIDSEQTEAVYLPVTCRKEQKKGEFEGAVAPRCINGGYKRENVMLIQHERVLLTQACLLDV